MRVICKKDGYEDFIIDMDARPAQADSTLRAFLMNDWSCYKEDGSQIKKPTFDRDEIQKKIKEDFYGNYNYFC